eukprot:6047453-Prymnesium_polylepis.1
MPYSVQRPEGRTERRPSGDGPSHIGTSAGADTSRHAPAKERTGAARSPPGIARPCAQRVSSAGVRA